MSAAPPPPHLLVLGLLGAGACYAPARAECSLTCASDSECVGGQVCSAQGVCAGSAIDCAEHLATDAGARDAAADHDAPAHVDARPPIDAPPVDAAPMVTLHLHDDGKGSITTNQGVVCDSQGPQHGDCTLAVVAGVPLTLVAAGEGNEAWKAWIGPACIGQPATCSFTPTLPLTDVRAVFSKH